MFRTAIARSANSKFVANSALKSQTRNFNISMNKVILLGNVGQDPKIIEFENGKKAAMFSLATSRRYKDADSNLVEQTEWHRIRFSNDKAELVERLIKKGTLVNIEGSLRYETFNKDGVDINMTTIVGTSFDIKLFPKRRDGEEGENTESSE
ncbi:hypothetical protein IWW55_003069 [Coemansia sp. RSA 2706]|nr:hypothetical protein LPJ63_004810 [Coemansia sp. RSA 2711]KAJ2303143.1 hypothetical protein IWW55_003069 [Coemansia sp. RSA 2706]KAJ2307328.1 hypothetical protein IWW54_004422 [Coemansia sp. RSA 2705]KAJ2321234.1 hypothetical protein IWW52_000875 [Coemansia sp. RSA 2704]KAJ2325633.1 hypothetical protein IWW51_002688 [Coemansia sp. RSA 2702]KAJ2366861.1 hypothetical protein H4S01_002478 [Coemansia sp. RSA 2610]KAJ2389908.1 hypothetical protein H4S02_002133 [Coemansia sp. RSA 2611]KAJ273122